jgi:predicted negative regulator of RcsB-dependent stress response
MLPIGHPSVSLCAAMSQVSKEDLRRPDEFVGFFESKIHQFENKKKQIFWALLIVLVVVGSGLIYQSKRFGNNQTAAIAFDLVMEKLPSNMSKSSGDWQTFLTGVDMFIRDYPRSSMTPSAYLYKGKAHFSLAQYDQALKAYQTSASKLKSPYVYLAKEGVAITQMQLEKWADALTVWTAISAKEDNPLRDFHMYNMALVQDQLGNDKEAAVTREKLVKDFPESTYAESVKLNQPAVVAQP